MCVRRNGIGIVTSVTLESLLLDVVSIRIVRSNPWWPDIELYTFPINICKYFGIGNGGCGLAIIPGDRSLNDCTQSASWPIPNIKELFARLGTHHSDTFRVMDLTAGYHQAPVSLVSLATRVYLAFICFCGIFQFCRLPFRPKRAPSYFQQMMSSVVLIGLLYFICEMYLDDCIVHAQGDDQFLERLELVLIRFQLRKVFLKPNKCKFGMHRVEYCGKVISKEGLSMSKKKITKVLDFPKPLTAGQMKQFIGLVDYFHDYVNNHSMIMKPLHNMINNYQKKTRGKALAWSEEGSKAFL
jgi:hypothetical protein